jgi:hypothetical protein
VPLINKREVNTAVLIEDGQTVVIGGVYEFRDRSDIQKVPFPRRHSLPGQSVQEEGQEPGEGGTAHLRDAEGPAGRPALIARKSESLATGAARPPFVFRLRPRLSPA